MPSNSSPDHGLPFIEIFERYGREVVEQQMVELKAYAERLTRAAISSIPNGRYESEDAMEGSAQGDRHPIRLALTIEGGSATFDFTGARFVAPFSCAASGPDSR